MEAMYTTFKKAFTDYRQLSRFLHTKSLKLATFSMYRIFVYCQNTRWMEFIEENFALRWITLNPPSSLWLLRCQNIFSTLCTKKYRFYTILQRMTVLVGCPKFGNTCSEKWQLITGWTNNRSPKIIFSSFSLKAETRTLLVILNTLKLSKTLKASTLMQAASGSVAFSTLKYDHGNMIMVLAPHKSNRYRNTKCGCRSGV